MARWATFDCYGTLIDWNGGIGRELERLFGAEHTARLLHGYHEVEREVERERPEASYREVLTVALVRLAEREGLALDGGDQDSLARSLPAWEPFPEVRAALEDVRGRGWKLAILSNTDRDFIDASMKLIGVPFEHVHVAASLYHDIAPARKLGLPTVWINRLGEEPEPQPDVELHSLVGLGDALESLAPA
jgi:2-haloacid dehalogenase